MCRDTWKVIQSLQLLVSHQMRPYSSVSALCDWAIPVSQVIGYWGNLGKLGPNTPNHVPGHTKSNSKSSDSYYTSNETLVPRPSMGRTIPVSQVLKYCGNLEKLGMNTQNHAQGHTKSSLNSSAPHFTSN